MSLEKQIQTDIMSAMKAHETVRLAALRGIKAAILLAKTSEGGNGEVSDADIVKIAEILGEIYDVKIILSPGMENLSTYSGELKKKETATEMLDALKHTLHIKYKIHNGVVFVSPE